MIRPYRLSSLDQICWLVGSEPGGFKLNDKLNEVRIRARARARARVRVRVTVQAQRQAQRG